MNTELNFTYQKKPMKSNPISKIQQLKQEKRQLQEKLQEKKLIENNYIKLGLLVFVLVIL